MAGFLRKGILTREMLGKTGIAAVLTVILALMFPRGESVDSEYKVGAVWARKDLIAPFSFSILRDDKEYTRDVDAAKRKVFDVFERDTSAIESQVSAIDSFFVRLNEALVARRRARRETRAQSPADSSRFALIASSLDIPFSDREWDVLALLSSRGELREMRRVLKGAAREFLSTGVLDRPKNSLTREDVALRKGTAEEIVPVVRLLDQNDVHAILEQTLIAKLAGSNDAVSLAYKIGVMNIHPNLTFSEAATAQALAAAADAVPRSLGFVQENERVVSKHERITQDTKQKLESLRRARAERGPASDRPTQILGTVLHVAMLVLLYGIYLFLFRKSIFENNRKTGPDRVPLPPEGAIAYLTREVDVNAPVEYLILVPVAAMLLTIMFDSRVGFYGTVTIAFLVAGIRGNDYSIALSSLVAGALAVYTVRDMKNRTQIFRSLGFIFLGYALTIIALGLERFESSAIVASRSPTGS